MKKLMRVSLIGLAILAVLVSAYLIDKNSHRASAEAVLAKSFNDSGAKMVNSEIYFWGKLDKKYRNPNKIKVLAEEFTNGLGIIRDEAFSQETVENDFVAKTDIHGISKDKLIMDICVQINKTVDSESEQFISVNVTEASPTARLDEIKKIVINVFTKYGISPRVNSCITGSFDGRLNYNELNTICQHIFSGINAKKVEGMRDDNLISVSAYSPYIGDSIKVKGNKVNINLALRYNSYENKTYIWIATPVITTEY